MVEVFSVVRLFRHLLRALPAVVVSAAVLATPLTSAAPGVTPDRPAPHSRPVPILMYHELGDGPNQLYVRVGEFERQLRFLAREGYRTVSLSEAGSLITGGTGAGGDPGDRPVVLTFDDGYKSHYTVAYPLLKEMGMTATFFVISGRIGQPGYISWDELKEMAGAGMEVGCHSANHPDLARTASNTVLEDEVSASKSALEERLQVKVSYFCYPAGKFNDALVARLKRAGYAGAVTTAPGWALAGSDPFKLRRVRISRSDNIRAFRTRLAQPWVYGRVDGGKTR